MLQEAVEFYHQLLQEGEVAESSRRMLDEGLERARLIFGGRRLSPYLRPHFVTESDFARVTRICETVWSAIQKVKDAAVEDEKIVEELGVTDIERELVRIDPGYKAVSPTARLDSFLTTDAYSFVELNGESPAGIAYADAAYEIFSSLPVMRRFAERYTLRTFNGRPLLLETLLEAYREFAGAAAKEKPSIAIVDLKGLPTQKEFELFKEYFESEGHPSAICSPDELEFSGGRLRCGEFEIDIVYKRLLVNEYLPIMQAQPALLEAYRAGAVCLVNNFRSKMIHKKALFAVLTDERYSRLFTDEELDTIRRHVPWTRKVREGRTEKDGAGVDLLEYVRRNSGRLVLKPNDDYGGHGIYIGWNSSEAEWEEALQAALTDGDYLVQERVPTARETFPALAEDGSVVYAEQLVDLDPLLFNGRVGSAFTRLSSTELANVSSGGGMVPTFIIDRRA
ncbi:MAG: circularly permuted type 2 ATP-grasp protein [Acidobacteria bacterium]|nr:circularly permuted type 2 ATP-grasp protein [Acidobacteriota bacterium]